MASPVDPNNGVVPKAEQPGSTGPPQSTVLLSEIPDAAAFTNPEPVAAVLTGANVSSGSLATLGQRYDILGEARGYVGRVYKARIRESEQILAIKLVKPELASDQAAMEALRDEILSVRKLIHKNVCRIYEANRVNGVVYISMEFVEGESLRSLISRFGALPLRRAIGVALEICSGLKEGHSQGIVHGHLKPENVMIDSSGNVKIMHFGITAAMQIDRLADAGAYSAPEQLSAKPADCRSDVYALGLVLYEFFTGKPAFCAENAASAAPHNLKVVPIPPHQIEPTIPVSVERAILKCLEKDPGKRFQSISELESALSSSGMRAILAAPMASAPSLSNREAIARSKAIVGASSLRPTERLYAYVWVFLGACVMASFAATAHWITVSRVARNLRPPSHLLAPVPPQFALEKSAASQMVAKSRAATSVAEAPPRQDFTAPGHRPDAAVEVFAAPANSVAENPFPQGSMETPAISIPGGEKRARSNLSSAGGSLNSVGATYIWIGRFQQEGAAQETAKRIESLGFPEVIVPRRNPANEFFVVLCGPFNPQKSSDVMQQLESQGFTDIHPIKNLIVDQKLNSR